jgi:ankyrin repeat protein
MGLTQSASSEVLEFFHNLILDDIPDFEEIERLAVLHKGIVDIADERDKVFPLHRVVSRKSQHEESWGAVNIKLLQLLLGQGVNLNSQLKFSGQTALHVACKFQNHDAAQLLVDNGINIECKDYMGWTALCVSCSLNDMTMVAYLIAKGADIDTSNGLGLTPLHIAATFDKIETMKLLIDNNANIELKTVDGKNALEFLKNKEHLEEMRKIFEEIGEKSFVFK